MPDVPHFVHRARLIVGETQDVFAERFGVDRATVSRWERGRLHPSPAIWRNIRQLIISTHSPTYDDFIAASPTFKYLVRMDDMFALCVASHGATDELRRREMTPEEFFRSCRDFDRAAPIYPSTCVHSFDVIQKDPRWLDGRIAYAEAHCRAATFGFLWANLMALPLIDRGEALLEWVHDLDGPGEAFWVRLNQGDPLLE
ncbi:MAG: helix-turn-helix domain-containing protein [Rhodomicrobium sp.]